MDPPASSQSESSSMSPSSPPPPTTIPIPPSTPSLSIAKTSSFLTHLTKHLSHTSTLDTTLLTATYTLTLLHSLLPHRSLHKNSLLARLTTSLPPLTALLSNLRVHLRLWGLIPLFNAGLELFLSPPASKNDESSTTEQKIKKATAWLQILSLITFQSLENWTFLAQKGVVSLATQKKQKMELWCSRAWMAWTFLEMGKLGWEGQARHQRSLRKHNKIDRKLGNEGESGEVAVAEKDEDEQYWKTWKRNLGVNAAYAPMTVHYSRQSPLLADRTVAVLGCVVAWLSFGDAWRGSA